MTVEQVPCLPKYPRVPDSAAGYCDAINTGMSKHPHACLCREEIAGTKDNAFACVTLDGCKKIPIAWAVVTLYNASTMNSNCRNSTGKSTIEDGEEFVLTVL